MDEAYWAFATFIGDPLLWTALIIALVAIYGFLGGKRPIGKAKARERRILRGFLLLAIPSLLLAFLGAEALKLAFQVPRSCVPCPAAGCNPYCPVTFSFPSGHTATIASIVTAVVLLLRKRRYLLLYALPMIVGASRMTLGVHQLSDVFWGFVYGVAATLLVWRFRRRIYGWEEEILLGAGER